MERKIKLFNEPTEQELFLGLETDKVNKTIKKSMITLILVLVWVWFIWELIGVIAAFIRMVF